MAASYSSHLAQQRGFASTHWTVIRACAGNDTVASKAREDLCRTYWYPIYAHIRRAGQQAEEPEDLTQAFFAHILGRPWFLRADSSKGKFRSFLLASLDRFLGDQRDFTTAFKRGGKYPHVPFDLVEAESRYLHREAASTNPTITFEVEWADTIVATSLQRLNDDYEAAEKAEQYLALKRFLTEEGAAGSYETAAMALGTTPGNIKVCISRLRKRYAAILREEVTFTVATPGDVDEEMRHLRQVLANTQL